MTSRSTQSAVLISLIVVLFAVLSLTVYSNLEEQGEKDPQRRKSQPLNISGLQFSDYRSDRLVSKIAVDRFFVRPINFKGFRIKSVNELFMDQANFEYHETSTSAPEVETGTVSQVSLGSGLARSVKGLAELRGIGRVVRGNAKGMTIHLYRDREKQMTVRAANAILDFKKGQTQLFNAVLVSELKNKRLSSDKIIWDDRQNIFIVAGDYYLSSSGSRVKDTSAIVTIDFEVRKIHRQ